MDTANRLRSYYQFSEDIVGTVSEIAERNHDLGYGDFVSLNNIPSVGVFTPEHGKPIEVLDICPTTDYDNVLVYHESMTTSLDENSVMHIAPLALALPTTRVIAVGNAGRPGEGYGKLSISDSLKLWNGNFRPIVDPTLEYLNSQKIDLAAHVGFSYGADRSIITAKYSENYDLGVPYNISIDPASVLQRGLYRLGKDFNRSGEVMDDYVKASDSKALVESREISGGMLGIAVSLFRITNLAISHNLAQPQFEDNAVQTLNSQPEMGLSLQWGSESEIAIDGMMLGIRDRLNGKYPERVKSARYIGQRHAMCDDIFFHVATILNGIEQMSEAKL